MSDSPRIAELESAIRRLLDVDSDMGIYPAAVSGYDDERDYEQRDGFKNGWNAAVMIYGAALNKIAYSAGVSDSETPLDRCPLCERPAVSAPESESGRRDE